MANNAVSTNLKNFYNSIISKNPLYFNHQFIITFEGADLPDEFKSDPSNSGSLTYYVQSSNIPAIQIDEQTVNFLGQDFVVPKGVTHAGTWSVTVTNVSSLRHYTALRAWISKYADLSRNGGRRQSHS